MEFSIIIPSYNRPRRVEQCLAGIAALETSPASFEVIVVDDGSCPPLDPVVRPFRERFSVALVRQPNSGPALARNAGARQARATWLVFLDDDCIPRPDWLTRLGQAIRQRPGFLLGGRVINGCPNNIYAEANQLLVDSVIDWFVRMNSPLRFFTSNNLAVPAPDFWEIGGFASEFRTAGGEDREFCSRWLQSGRSLALVPDVCIDHFHPQTLLSFLQMHSRYGSGAAQLHKQRKAAPARLASSSGLYLHLIRSFLAARRLRQFPLLLLSQAATVAGFFTHKPGSDLDSTTLAEKAARR